MPHTTVTRRLLDTINTRGSDLALRRRVGDEWESMTWSEYGDKAARIATALRDLGVQRGDRVVMLMRNRPEFNVCDAAALFANATPFSIYSSSAPEQIHYLASHSEATVAIVEDIGFLERLLKVRDELPGLKHIVVIDDADGLAGPDVQRLDELLQADPIDTERAAADTSPDDLLTLVYTSGTTGPPKGAMILQRNVASTWGPLDERIGDSAWLATSSYLSYLPLAHVLERWYAHYSQIFYGYSVTHCPDPSLLTQHLPLVRPEAFVGVPRVWEKIRSGLQAAIAADPKIRAAFEAALAVGDERVEFEERREPLPDDLRVRWEETDRSLLANIRGLVGLDRCRIGGIGAAPSPPGLIRFFRAMGVPLVEGFGMTETTFIASIDINEPRLGTAGRMLSCVESRLADDGELLVRGPNIIPGYLKDPERTAETFDADGWLHTGDIAQFDADGYVRIVDRKKELIITAGGKNISPANIEAALKSFPLIGQACVIGDDRPYLAALLVLDPDAARSRAASNGLDATSIGELATHPDIVGEIEASVAEANKRFSRAEQIKRFAILSAEWAPDSNELTPTMKMKRRGIHEKYRSEIEALYR